MTASNKLRPKIVSVMIISILLMNYLFVDVTGNLYPEENQNSNSVLLEDNSQIPFMESYNEDIYGERIHNAPSIKNKPLFTDREAYVVEQQLFKITPVLYELELKIYLGNNPIDKVKSYLKLSKLNLPNPRLFSTSINENIAIFKIPIDCQFNSFFKCNRRLPA